MVTVEKPRTRTRRHTKVGVVVTLTYLVGLGFYCWLARSKMVTLEPNEVGDLLAGAFSPLAFLWLVLGYIQQGEELKNSADALWLQGRELQNSVEQQRELVQVTRDQLALDQQGRDAAEREASRDAMPTLVLRGSVSNFDAEHTDIAMELHNLGPLCTAVSIYYGVSSIRQMTQFVTDSRQTLHLRLKAGQPANVPVRITYTDRRGRRAFQKFDVSTSYRGNEPLAAIIVNDPELGEWPALDGIIDEPGVGS